MKMEIRSEAYQPKLPALKWFEGAWDGIQAVNGLCIIEQ